MRKCRKVREALNAEYRVQCSDNREVVGGCILLDELALPPVTRYFAWTMIYSGVTDPDGIEALMVKWQEAMNRRSDKLDN